MTGDPTLTVAATRDPSAEAAIGAGLAAYNADRFRPGDMATLDILVRDDNSSVRSRSNCSAAHPTGSGVIEGK